MVGSPNRAEDPLGESGRAIDALQRRDGQSSSTLSHGRGLLRQQTAEQLEHVARQQEVEGQQSRQVANG